MDAPEAVADEAKVQPLVASMDVEGLRDGALGDDQVDVRELPEADVEAGEGGDGEERHWEGHV